MKKNIFKYALLAMVTTAFVSCSIDSVTEINKGNAIDFRVATTRATELKLANLGEFNVTALNADTQAPYFTDLTFSNDGNVYKATTDYFWPQYNLDFYAYAPISLNENSDGEMNIVYDYEIETPFNIEYTPASEIANQEDIVAAYALGNKESNEEEGVEIVFNHLLTRIDIQASNINEGYVYKVLGAKIANVADSGTATYHKETTNDTGNETITIPAYWEWVAGTDKTSYEVPQYNAYIQLTDEPESLMGDEGSAMIIPQELIAYAKEESGSNNEGTYIGLLVNIKTATGIEIYPKAENGDITPVLTDESDNGIVEDADGEKYAWIAVPISGLWEVGKYYTYNIQFNELDKLIPEFDNVESIVGSAITIDVNVGSFGSSDDEGHDPYKEYDLSKNGETEVTSAVTE